MKTDNYQFLSSIDGDVKMKERRAMDRRIQRTRHMLSDALFALIVERGYEPITVQDITERANVGRATFYLHYHDKEHLLEDSLLRLFDDLTKNIEPGIDFAATYQSLSVRVFQSIAEQHKLYHALLNKGGPPSITMRMHTCLVPLIQHRVLKPLTEQSTSTIDAQLLAMHCAGSLLSLIVWWLDHELAPSAEQMGDLFWRLISPGIEAVLGVKAARLREGQ